MHKHWNWSSAKYEVMWTKMYALIWTQISCYPNTRHCSKHLTHTHLFNPNQWGEYHCPIHFKSEETEIGKVKWASRTQTLNRVTNNLSSHCGGHTVKKQVLLPDSGLKVWQICSICWSPKIVSTNPGWFVYNVRKHCLPGSPSAQDTKTCLLEALSTHRDMHADLHILAESHLNPNLIATLPKARHYEKNVHSSSSR